MPSKKTETRRRYSDPDYQTAREREAMLARLEGREPDLEVTPYVESEVVVLNHPITNEPMRVYKEDVPSFERVFQDMLTRHEQGKATKTAKAAKAARNGGPE